MIENMPYWVELLFILAWLFAVVCFHLANGKPKLVTSLIIFWGAVNCALAYNGFYLDTEAIPPRFGLILIPMILLITIGLLPRQRRWFKEVRDNRFSTLLHTVRLPVEIVLLQLFLHGMVPESMTFQGSNFDIVMGITAPLIFFLLITKKIGRMGLILWNGIGLILILTILTIGVLSAELPFQQLAFDQPNRGLAFFPFVLLPATIVPLVIWTHLSDLVILFGKSTD